MNVHICSLCRDKTSYNKGAFAHLRPPIWCTCFQADRKWLLQCAPHESSSAQRSASCSAPSAGPSPLSFPTLPVRPPSASQSVCDPLPPHPRQILFGLDPTPPTAPPQSHNPIRTHGRLTGREAESTAARTHAQVRNGRHSGSHVQRERTPSPRGRLKPLLKMQIHAAECES